MTNALSNASDDLYRSANIQRQTFCLARSPEELCQAFRLVFQSYLQAGLAIEKPSGMRLTPHHLLPTSEVLLAKVGNTVTTTLSMFGDGYLGLPMDSMYSVETRRLRDEGLRLAEIGCLADRRDSQIRFLKTFAQLGRLLAQVARSRETDGFVVATHPKHARLYKRILGFRQIGDLSDCPYANGNPAVALVLKFEEHEGTPLHDLYFGDPIPQDELAPYRWEPDTRKFFKQILDRDNKISSLSGIQGYYNWAVLTNTLTPS
ncbi:hypothetical protein Pla22_23380 [Rubripirellula amarantea]|uniref:N-acyl amino acid synthase FeeM catalytic core domain-containing protein n=1 Tax=Rubripirellula amarantea TaxID=2527999 RepID=A0A5C5WVU7_9BACT|nr:long-chain N-acyl amino acid synthase [Rubripirellula amarantea]TWT54688.1 hypothetical protein Pla22_23380 [Rubripirellula amarantea]